MTASALESLLRAAPLTKGRIALDVVGGRWGATVTHFGGHMTHHMGDYHDDPVDALRVTLIEDERRCREAAATGRPFDMLAGLRADLVAPVPGDADPLGGLIG